MAGSTEGEVFESIAVYSWGLQCAAVCCSVLPYIAVYCSVCCISFSVTYILISATYIPFSATNRMPALAVCSWGLQCAAVCCSVLPYIAVYVAFHSQQHFECQLYSHSFHEHTATSSNTLSILLRMVCCKMLRMEYDSTISFSNTENCAVVFHSEHSTTYTTAQFPV